MTTHNKLFKVYKEIYKIFCMKYLKILSFQNIIKSGDSFQEVVNLRLREEYF